MFISAKETSLTATEYWHNRTKRNEVLCMYSEVFPLYRVSDLSRNTVILQTELYRGYLLHDRARK